MSHLPLPTDRVRELAACILSGQVPQEDVPRLCQENPGLAAAIRPPQAAPAPPPPAPHIGLFEDNALPLEVSLKQQIACVQRELKQRARVYPRLVADGKMTADGMKSELGQMQAVLRTLEGLRFGIIVPDRLEADAG